MSYLPSFIVKKDGHTARFSKEKLETSLLKTARHARFNDSAALTSILREIFLRIGTLERETIPVAKVREVISKTLKEKGLDELADAYDLTFLHIHALRLQKVQKRNGSYDDFRPYNIFKSLAKSFRDARKEHPEKAAEITKEVAEELEATFGHHGTPTTRDVKRVIEQALTRHGLEDVRNAYRAHRFL